MFFTSLQLIELFRPGMAYNSKLSQALQSLTKLSLMRERLEELNSSELHTNVVNTIFSRVMRDACQWVSIVINNYG